MAAKKLGLVALLGPAKDEDNEEKPRRKNALLEDEPEMDEDDDDMGDDEEGLAAAQALLDAIESKDATAVLEAFSQLASVT